MSNPRPQRVLTRSQAVGGTGESCEQAPPTAATGKGKGKKPAPGTKASANSEAKVNIVVFLFMK